MFVRLTAVIIHLKDVIILYIVPFVRLNEHGELNIMNWKGGLIIIIILVAGIAGGLYVLQLAPVEDLGTPATLVIDFTPMDKLAGEQDAATSAVGIYNTDLVLLETVTMDAASKASVLQYTTGDRIGLYINDATDVSICKQYAWVTIPKASAAEVYGQAFQYTIWNVDRNLAPPLNVESGGAAIADAEIEDVSTNGWDSAYAYIDFEIRPATDDLGYVNTDNFLLGYQNNHYFVISIADVSGSTLGGWFAINLLGSSALTLDRNDVRYYCFPLSDSDLERNLQSDGTYDPTGLWQQNLAFDMTSFDTGNNCTLTYEYIWYSSWDNFVERGSWGADHDGMTAETFHIQY